MEWSKKDPEDSFRFGNKTIDLKRLTYFFLTKACVFHCLWPKTQSNSQNYKL